VNDSTRSTLRTDQITHSIGDLLPNRDTVRPSMARYSNFHSVMLTSSSVLA
jgi:hypothetical protein